MVRVVCSELRLGSVSLVSCWADGEVGRRTWRSHCLCVLMCEVVEDGELEMMRDKLPKLLPVMCCHGCS
jgi:hypothetical protein